MNIIGLIQGAFYKMFGINQIKNITGTEPITSSVMSAAMDSWKDAFMAKVAGDDKLKPLNIAYFATGYIGKLTNLELDITLGGGERAKYILNILNDFKREQLNKAAQLTAALSHTVIKPYVSRGELVVEIIKADRFYPMSYEGGRMTSCLFIDEYQSGDKIYRRLEYHKFEGSRYVIENRAFVSSSKSGLGSEISLASVEPWADISPVVRLDNIKRPLFGYFKTPFANNIDLDSPLPISIYANAMVTLKEIEAQYANYCHEFKSARRKRYIDQRALSVDPDTGKTTADDTDDYVMIKTIGNDEDFFEDYTPAIRETELRQGLETQLRILETQLQISQGTFSINPLTGAVTATQIISTDKTTYHTVQDFQKGEEQALKELVYAMDVYCTLYRLAPAEKVEPAFTFGDSVFEDTGTVLAQKITLESSGIISKAEVRSWYVGETVEQAKINLPKPGYKDMPDDEE